MCWISSDPQISEDQKLEMVAGFSCGFYQLKNYAFRFFVIAHYGCTYFLAGKKDNLGIPLMLAHVCFSLVQEEVISSAVKRANDLLVRAGINLPKRMNYV
jgi:hypothetical protein